MPLKFPKGPKKSTRKAKAQRAHRADVAATRRAVFERDRGKCRVCVAHRWCNTDGSDIAATEMHEIIFRSQGGKQVTENCIALCMTHHRRIHARRLWIVGTDANGPLTFQTEKPQP